MEHRRHGMMARRSLSPFGVIVSVEHRALRSTDIDSNHSASRSHCVRPLEDTVAFFFVIRMYALPQAQSSIFLPSVGGAYNNNNNNNMPRGSSVKIARAGPSGLDNSSRHPVSHIALMPKRCESDLWSDMTNVGLQAKWVIKLLQAAEFPATRFDNGPPTPGSHTYVLITP